MLQHEQQLARQIPDDIAAEARDLAERVRDLARRCEEVSASSASLGALREFFRGAHGVLEIENEHVPTIDEFLAADDEEVLERWEPFHLSAIFAANGGYKFPDGESMKKFAKRASDIMRHWGLSVTSPSINYKGKLVASMANEGRYCYFRIQDKKGSGRGTRDTAFCLPSGMYLVR